MDWVDKRSAYRKNKDHNTFCPCCHSYQRLAYQCTETARYIEGIRHANEYFMCPSCQARILIAKPYFDVLWFIPLLPTAE